MFLRYAVFTAILWSTAASADPARIIGGQSAGCIAGAVELPADGPGFQTIRRSRSSFWGHPAVVGAVEELAAEASSAGLPPLYIGDLSRPGGGPIPGGHASHQLGLDADIYLDVTPKPALDAAGRNALEPRSLVRADQRDIDPAQWRPAVATLIHLATALPGVDRVLVNAAIKQQLCRTVSGDRAWLRLVRPWYGHASHMHVHFRCPAGQPDCRDGAPPPPGDGCDAMGWWFSRLDEPPPVAAPSTPPALPAACIGIVR